MNFKDFTYKIDGILPSGGVARKISTVAAGSAIGYGVYFLATPLLTRLYSPADFGILGTYVSLLGIFAASPSFAFDRAIPIAKDEETARSLLMAAFCSIILTATIISCGIVVLNSFPNQTLLPSLKRLGIFAWLLPIGVVAEGTHIALAWWAIRQRAYKKIAIAKLSQGLSQTIIQVGLGFFSGGPLSLLIGDTCGRSMGFSSLLNLGEVWRDVLKVPSRIKLHFKTAWSFKRFSILEVISSYINTLGLQIPILLLVASFSSKEIGLYVIADRLLSAPVSLIGKSMSQVYSGEMALTLRENPGGFRSRFINVIKRLNWIGLGLSVTIVILSPMLIGIFLGNQWHSVGILMAIRAPILWSQIVALPVCGCLTLLQRQDIQVCWDISRLLLITTAIIGGIHFGYGLFAVAAIHAAATWLSYGLLVFLIFIFSPKSKSLEGN